MRTPELSADELTLPIKRTDGDTIEERLTGNAYHNILPARYLKKDANGDLAEDQEGLFKRVARNIALAEAVYEAEKRDVEVTVTPDQLKPDHPRRDELAAEVFGAGTTVDDDAETTLTEHNVNKFAYETIVPKLPEGVREHVKNVAGEFQEMMEYLKWLPNSPTLMNAGDELQQLSACFVMSPEDDLTDIHEKATEAAEVFQSGGGVGYAFWRLRPYGDSVGSTGGIASGPLTFMETFDQLCETIAQGGARRGAQMAIMRVSHPDVIEFIHSKRKAVSLAHQLKLNDPDDFTYTTFSEALEEARELIDEDGKVPEHLRNAVEGHLSNFNISVGVTDDFMEALQAGEEYTFINPRTGEPHVASEETEEMYGRYDLGEYVEPGEELSVPAEVLWERIVEGAHENGEPGVIYLDRVNDEHSFPVESTPTGDGSEYEILATNPSLAAGTKVLTDQGIVDIEQLEGKRTEVPTLGGEWADAICRRSGDNETLYEVELANGKRYFATEEHKWPVLDDGSYERTKTTEIGEGARLPIEHRKSLQYGSRGDHDQGFLVGWLYGDGSVTHRKDGRTQYGFTFSEEDATAGVMDRVLDTLEDITGVDYTPNERKRDGEPWYEIHASHAALRNVMSEFGVDKKSEGIPEAIWNDASESFRKGFIDGLFSADGYVDSDQNRIVLVSAKETLIKDVSDLLGFYGLKTSLRDSEVEKWGSTYDRWDLKLSRTQAHKFRETFGLTHEGKSASLAELKTPDRGNVLSDNVEVVAVREADRSGPVWDLRVDDETHTFALSHALTGNCGEQPLMEYEACNLGHINLSTVADTNAPDWRVWSDRHREEYDTLEAAVDAFLADAIDREEFDHRIEWGTRFLENVVTMSNFPVEKIEETVRNNRKVGLGIMGLAQLYIQLGVAYGSDVANEIARQLMVDINHGSKWTSHELAGDRASFANWEDSKYANPTEYADWFERMTGLDAEEWADGFPIRNHNTTTIAPTGCVEENSLLSTDEGLVPIKDLDETTAEFEQWNEIEVGVSTDGGTKAATAVYDNGFADVRRIETEGGFSVASTPDHRFRTITDDGEYVWQEAAEFESGDRILLQRGTFDSGSRATLDTSERRNYHWNSDEQLELPSEMTPELAEFLGYFMGDGYVHEDVGVKLVVESDAQGIDAYLRKLGESVFGVSPTVEDRDTRHVLVFGGRHLPRYFEDNGWKKADGNEGEGAASAFVPDEVLQGNEAVAKAFLRGLFEADGTASRKVELSTVSETLADQVQTLLLALGCVFVRDTLETADRNDHYGDRPRHSVRGANKREDQRFLEEVGLMTKSTEFDLTPQSHKNDTYPPAVVDSLRDVSGYDSVSKPVKNRVNQSRINGSVSRKLVGDIEEETGETVRIDGRPLVDFYAATVGSVTEETAYTKDISVPSNNTYVANGFVTHNTTSMVGNTSGGCEPIYNVAYYKNVSDDVQGDEMLVEFDDYFLRVLEDNDIPIEAVKEEAKDQMATNSFDGVDGLTTVPDAIGELFVTTSDLSAKQHASVQCACQVGVDSAISKCLQEGTLVQTDSGVRPIESFAEETPEPGEFVSVEEEVTIDGVPVESQYYAGEKDATRIRVDNGTELVGATESHKVLTPEGWTTLGDLEEGDYVVGRHVESHGDGGATIDFVGVPDVAADGGVEAVIGGDRSVHKKPVDLPSEMSPHLARFLGMYAAEGSAIDAGYSVEISTSSERVRDEARDLFEELFGRNPTIKRDTRRGNQRDTVFNIGLNSKPVWEFVTRLCGSGSYQKAVPDEILQGSPGEKLAFVNGVTLDGYVSSQSLVVYGGMSRDLADGVAELLRSFGVPKVYVGRKWVAEAEAYAYNVHVTNDAQELVTPIEPHKRVDRFDQRYRVHVPQDRVDKTEFDSRSQEYYAARTFEYRNRNHMFDTTAEKLGVTDAPPLYEVTDVEDAGSREMYDVELAGPHEYVVGGIVSHNTVNAPNDSTVEDAAEVFEYIYENGGKGVTYYRDGTRSKQVLTTRAQNTEFSDMDEDEATEALLERVEDVFGGMEEFLAREDVREAIETDVAEIFDVDVEASVDYSEKRPRPDVLHGVTQRIETGYGKLYVNINEDERGQPFELFATIGNSGGFTNSFTEALAKTVSTAMRSGVDPGEIADELQGIRSPKVAWDKGEQIQSIPDAVGTAMRRYLDGDIDRAYPQQRTLEETAEDGGEVPDEEETRENLQEAEASAEPDGGVQPTARGGTTSDDATRSLVDAGESPECPECGSMSLHFSEGCKTCEACGWSEC